MILVTGASGNVGRAVVEQLVAAGEPVRALNRQPHRVSWPTGVEPVAGDLAAGVPAEALAGVSALHLFPAPGLEGTVRAAAAAGVRHVVVLSSLAVDTMAGSRLAHRHRGVEEVVEASGMTWTHLRPGMFMTNMLAWAELVRTDGVVRQPYGDAVAAPVHEADIAAVAVAALLDPAGHAGRAHQLSGPEALSQRERAAVIADVTGRPVRFVELSPDDALEEMLASPRMDRPMASTILRMVAGTVGVRDGVVLPGVEEVLGRPARTFARWVADHRDAFVPGAATP